MTGFRFALSGPGRLSLDLVELDGIPRPGDRLRVVRDGVEADLVIVSITWFHAPGALSKSGLLTLSETPP